MGIGQFHTLDHEGFLKRYDIDIHFPPPFVLAQPNFLELLWKKVCEFFEKVWRTFCFWETETDFKLTSKQIKLIEIAKENKKYFDPKPKAPELVSVEFLPTPKAKAYVSQYPNEKTLASFCQVFEEFSQVLLIDCIKKVKVDPALPPLQKEVMSGIDQLKLIEIVANLKNSAAPLFKNIGNLDDPALTILAQQLFQILLKPLAYEQHPLPFLEKVLTERILALKEKKEISEEQYEKILTYIKPILRWLFNSNNWLINSPHPVLLHNFLVDFLNFLDSFSKLYKDGALNGPISEIKKQVESSFIPDMEELLKLNVKPVANILGFRFSELIENLPFSEAFNSLIKLIIGQMDGWIAAENHKKETEALIATSKHDAEQIPKTSVGVDIKQKALDFLKNIKSEGGEAKYVEQEFNSAYRKTPACHPLVGTLIQAKSDKDKQSAANEDIYDYVLDMLFPYLLPPEQVKLPDGSLIEISGIAKILNAIQYPANIENLFTLADQIINTVIEKGEFKNKANFTKYFQTLRKVVLTQLIHQHVKEYLREGLRELFNFLTLKENLDIILADLVLPPLIEVIFINWVRTTLFLNIDQFYPIFNKFLLPDNNFKLCMLEITDQLYEMMVSKVIDFNLIEAGINKEKFKQILEPLIIEIISNLLQRLKSADPETKFSSSEVVTVLKKYLYDDKVPLNDLYTDFTNKALFEIGNFKLSFLSQSMTEKVLHWLRDTLKEQISIAMHEVSSSYHPAISSLVTSFKTHLLDPKALNALFFPPEISLKAEEAKKAGIKESLQKNLHRISALTHDALYRGLEAGNWGHLAKQFSPSTSTIKDTISAVVNKVLGNAVLNKSLIVKIVDLFGENFKKAEEKLQTLKGAHSIVPVKDSSLKDPLTLAINIS